MSHFQSVLNHRQKVVTYLYCGRLPENLSEIAFDLIPFAEKYLLEDLKAACEVALRPVISKDDVIQALILAHVHRCSNLFKFCIPLFKANIEELKETEQWEELKEELKELPDLLSQLLLSCSGAGDANHAEEEPEIATLPHLMKLSKDLMSACEIAGSLELQVCDVHMSCFVDS